MEFLPFRQFELDSPLSVGEAHATLSAEVEPRKLVRLVKGLTFEGSVSQTRFELRRRKGLLPLIQGEFSSQGKGCRVAIRMKLSAFDWCKELLRMSLFGAVAWLIAVPRLSAGDYDLLALFLCLAFLSCPVTIGVMFAHQARKAEAELKRIFAATRRVQLLSPRPTP